MSYLLAFHLGNFWHIVLILLVRWNKSGSLLKIWKKKKNDLNRTTTIQGHKRIGHVSIGQNRIGHKCTGHKHIGYKRIGHKCTRHKRIGHKRIAHKHTRHKRIGQKRIGHKRIDHKHTRHKRIGHKQIGHKRKRIWREMSHQLYSPKPLFSDVTSSANTIWSSLFKRCKFYLRFYAVRLCPFADNNDPSR